MWQAGRRKILRQLWGGVVPSHVPLMPHRTACRHEVLPYLRHTVEAQAKAGDEIRHSGMDSRYGRRPGRRGVRRRPIHRWAAISGSPTHRPRIGPCHLAGYQPDDAS